jgi:hypothetical protein
MQSRSSFPVQVLSLCALVSSATPAAAQSYTPTNPDTGGSILFGGAFEVSNAGTLVGFADFGPGSSTDPALWNATGSHALPLLAGDDIGIAGSVNEQGQAVGVSTDVQDMGPLTTTPSGGSTARCSTCARSSREAPTWSS